MLTFVFVILSGIVIAYFVALNPTRVSINLGPHFFGDFVLNNIPLYLVALVPFLIGATIATAFSVVRYIALSFQLKKTNGQLKAVKKELADVTKQVHQLELQNVKLKTKNGESDIDDDSL